MAVKVSKRWLKTAAVLVVLLVLLIVMIWALARTRERYDAAPTSAPASSASSPCSRQDAQGNCMRTPAAS